jgi:hypothetical protein
LHPNKDRRYADPSFVCHKLQTNYSFSLVGSRELCIPFDFQSDVATRYGIALQRGSILNRLLDFFWSKWGDPLNGNCSTRADFHPRRVLNPNYDSRTLNCWLAPSEESKNGQDAKQHGHAEPGEEPFFVFQ